MMKSNRVNILGIFALFLMTFSIFFSINSELTTSSTIENQLDVENISTIFNPNNRPNISQFLKNSVNEPLISYTDHSPILIDGNQNFTDTASAENWDGDGGEDHPFIITNLNISVPFIPKDIEDLSGISLIEIKNINLHFEIVNCLLFGGIDGILLTNVMNGQIVDNIILNSSYSSIRLINTSNIVLNNNFINFAWRNGILLNSSYNCVISENIIQNCTNSYGSINAGIYVIESSNIDLIDNYMTGKDRGIILDLSDHVTLYNNVLFSDAEALLAEKSLFLNITQTHTNSSIQLSSCNSSIFQENIIYFGRITCFYSIFNNFTSNILYHSYYDGVFGSMRLSYCDNCSVEKNIFYGNHPYGLSVESSNCTIKWNDFISNDMWEDSQLINSGINNIYDQNFYDDWSSPDVNNDDIVDNPYKIGPEYTYDQHPLTSPHNPSPIHYLSNPTIIFPKGKEGITVELNGTITIQWMTSFDSFGHTVTYSVYAKLDALKESSSFNEIASDLTTTSYQWDTSDIGYSDSVNLLIRAICSEGTSESTLKFYFSIKNQSKSSPFESIPFFVASMIVCCIILKIKRNREY